MEVEPKIVYEKSDGEISSDPEAIEYNPLERPVLPKPKENPAPQTYNSDDDELSNQSESSQSDSDCGDRRQPKRAKIKPKNIRHANKKQSKYSVWNARAQEDLLTETMNSCDVTKLDRSRDVETYIFPKRNLKRTFNDRSNVHLRLGKRVLTKEEEASRSAPRHLLDLTVTVDSANDEVATDISNKLYEEKDDILKNLIEAAGKAKAIELFNETKKIEADGGMLIMNQRRRRTPGGVYFFLVKRDDDITEEQKKNIFREDKAKLNREKKKNRRSKAGNSSNKNKTTLPNLLSRAELEISKGNRTRKDSDHTENVSNPPPSPVTDGRENSSDEMTDHIESPAVFPMNNTTTTAASSDRNLQAYDDDFLEIGCSGDMDFFS